MEQGREVITRTASVRSFHDQVGFRLWQKGACCLLGGTSTSTEKAGDDR